MDAAGYRLAGAWLTSLAREEGIQFGPVFGTASRATAALTMTVLLAAGAAFAEEWHEAYRVGVQALARGDNRRAVESLKRAIAQRPEPGRNVVTYGTNIEARYFPYLRLAEAYLALGEFDAAREALQASAARNREPADERRQLEARLENAVAPPRLPPPTVAAAPSPVPPPPSTLAPSAAPPEVTIPAQVPAPTIRPTPPPRIVVAPSAGARPTPTPTPVATPFALPAAGPSGAVEVISQPPGAVTYLDDEPIGSTDPETGRLVKTNLRPGRHRVRVMLPGYDELVREVEVPTVGSVAINAALKPHPATASAAGTGVVAFGVVALALVAVVAWMALRKPATQAPVWSATPAALARPTPPGHANPGAERDEQGQEWFGEFRLIELLGRGGMASVYKAERNGELLALKRPLASFLDDADFRERFLREAEIGRTLNHPNIVRILGRGNVDEVPYFTMELMLGQTLQAFIRDSGGAPPRTAAAIVAQVAEALDFAHTKGVVHRDLKPSNIMLLPDGTAKVMDFGIARARRFEGLTATGAFLGTPDYVAPEIIEGHGAEARSDLYSVGTVFYELLTGQRPFSGETAFAVLKKQCTEQATPPSQIRRGIPAELDTIIHRLLAKTPEGRHASAEELVVALRDWLNRAV